MNSNLSLPADESLPPEVVQRLKDRPAVNIFRMLGHAPQCVIPFTDTVAALYKTTLSAREREIAILRQGARAQGTYELHQHKLIARTNGMTDGEIEAIVTFQPQPFASARENLICTVADELERDVQLSDATFEQAKKEFGDRQFVELLLVISFYACVARFTNGTRIPIEKGNPMSGHANPN